MNLFSFPILLSAHLLESQHCVLPFVATQFRTGRPDTAFTVEYRTEGALELQSASQTQLLTDTDGNVIDTPRVRALANGVHFLNVFVTLGKRSRAISIPVTIGTALPAAKTSGKTINTPQGDSVMVLPAQETVHRR